MTPEQRAQKKERIKSAQEIKDEMMVDQLIAFVNTPYKDLPENLQAGMTKRPQKFCFVKMTHKNIGEQRETFAARLIRYRTEHHLSVDEFATIANEFAKMYGAKVSRRDIYNYENFNVCPKIDKMTAISEAMGVSMNYFAGYGPIVRKSRNALIEQHKDVLSVGYKAEMERRKGVEGYVFSSATAA